LRGHAGLDVVFFYDRFADVDVGVFEVEVWVGVAADDFVALGMNDLLHLLVDEIIEGVDVLSNKAPDTEECRE